MEFKELDRVELTRSVDKWPAGSKGTIVSLNPHSALVEMPDPHYESETLLDCLVDVLFADLKLLQAHRPS